MQAADLSGRTAIVTGASRGIGAATALALARRRIATALLVRDPGSAAATRDAVLALGVPCLVLACDVADPGATEDAVRAAVGAWGRIDIVVNNAGQIDPIGHLADTDPAAWSRALAVNLAGPYHVLHAALPELLRSASAAVVNLSTGAAHAPREGWSAYCSAKAGLAMLTRCLAHEYGARGVASYGLQPGLVDTDMQERIRGSGMNEISLIPKAKLAPAERSAGVVAWLADARPEDLRGQDLSVNDADLVARSAAGERSH